MIQVRISICILRPAADFFADIANFENNLNWQSNPVEVHITSEGELAIGSPYTQVSRDLGRTVESHFEVVEFVPNRMFKLATTAAYFPITITRMVEPEGEGARVRALIEGDPTGFYIIAEPVLTQLLHRTSDADSARLKQILGMARTRPFPI